MSSKMNLCDTEIAVSLGLKDVVFGLQGSLKLLLKQINFGLEKKPKYSYKKDLLIIG